MIRPCPGLENHIVRGSTQVMRKSGHAPSAIAAGRCFRSIGIEIPHLEMRSTPRHCRFYHDDTIPANAKPAVAKKSYKFRHLFVRYCLFPVIKPYKIITRACQFPKPYLHISLFLLENSRV
jgi:hypothetical protein